MEVLRAMEDPSLNQLYQEILMDHYRDPRNFGELSDPDCRAEGFNPMCGDRVEISLRFSPDKKCLLEQRFKGEGCSICMASASMMTEEISGKSIAEILHQVQGVRDHLQGKSSEAFEGDLAALEGVRRFPVRIKCALLPWTTLRDAIEKGCSVVRKLTDKEDQS